MIDGTLAAFNGKDFAKSCSYTEPATQAGCKSEASQIPASKTPTAKNFAIGYVVIDGDKAVVGTTGTVCTPGNSPECFTNNDPSAVFSTLSSFSELWSNAIKNSSGYSLAPCVKINGDWYIYSTSLWTMIRRWPPTRRRR